MSLNDGEELGMREIAAVFVAGAAAVAVGYMLLTLTGIAPLACGGSFLTGVATGCVMDWVNGVS